MDIDKIKAERDILQADINKKIKDFITKYEIAINIEHYNTSDYGKDDHYIVLEMKM